MTPSLDARQVSEDHTNLERDFLDKIEWFDEIGSTNDYLLAEPPPSAGQGRVAIAKHQTAGRGRRGQKWQSSSSSSICLSISHTFAGKPENLASIALAIGVSIAAALRNRGAVNVALKWPNDLMIDDAKLGGILAEVHSSQTGATTVVVGIGLNIDLTRNPQTFAGLARDRAVGDLSKCFGSGPTYEDIAILLIDSMHHAFTDFESRGFSVFFANWQSFDWLRDRAVRITVADEESAGICGGIDFDGALILNSSAGVKRFISGSVSIDENPGLAARK